MLTKGEGKFCSYSFAQPVKSCAEFIEASMLIGIKIKYFEKKSASMI